MRNIGIVLLFCVLLSGCTRIPMEYTKYNESGQVVVHVKGTYTRFLTKQEVIYNPATGLFELRTSTDSDPAIEAAKTVLRLSAAGATMAP